MTLHKHIDVTIQKEDWDQTFQMISWWKKDVMNKAKIMVVGAGALGNEVLKNLALLNVGYIIIVDYDHIEYANLCRSVLFREKDCKRKQYKATMAAKRIKELNPTVRVQTIKGDVRTAVGYGLVKRMDVVIGCLDNRLARLHLNQMCFKAGITWIDAAIENLGGEVNVYQSGKSCYECNLTKIERKNILAQKSCGEVAKMAVKKGRIPTTPISSSIAAAIQVQEALKIIHHYKDKSLAGETIYFEGLNNVFQKFKNPPLKEMCSSHFTYESVINSPLSVNSTIATFLDWVGRKIHCKRPVLKMDNELVLEVAMERSEKKISLRCARPNLEARLPKLLKCTQERAVIVTRSITEIDHNFRYKKWKLKDLQIPPFHILEVRANERQYFIELEGDAQQFTFLKKKQL